VREIADNLWNDNPSVQSDRLKVLYEIGHLDPSLIAGYADGVLKLLHSKNNRLICGGMIGLSTIAGIKAKELGPHVSEIMKAVDQGSMITQDSGVKALAFIAPAGSAYQKAVFPCLLNHLATCRRKDVAQRTEKVLAAVPVEVDRLRDHVLPRLHQHRVAIRRRVDRGLDRRVVRAAVEVDGERGRLKDCAAGERGHEGEGFRKHGILRQLQGAKLEQSSESSVGSTPHSPNGAGSAWPPKT
jgi:hypothetical protein